MKNIDHWKDIEVRNVPQARESDLQDRGAQRQGAKWLVKVPCREINVWELDHLLHTLECEGATVRGRTPVVKAAV